jgi:hypothetical protein
MNLGAPKSGPILGFSRCSAGVPILLLSTLIIKSSVMELTAQAQFN